VSTVVDFAKSALPETWRMRVADWRGRGIYAGFPDHHNCIFIHVPKTGGTSVARALFNENSRHVTFDVYENANPAKFRRYFKFGFVRNPWARTVSAYFYLRAGGRNESDRAWSECHIQPYENFRAFVREKLGEADVQAFTHFIPQSRFLARADGRLVADFIGRFEKLQDDFAFVAKKLRISAALPLANEGSHEDYRKHYDEDTRELVAKIYARDAQMFGYAFGR